MLRHRYWMWCRWLHMNESSIKTPGALKGIEVMVAYRVGGDEEVVGRWAPGGHRDGHRRPAGTRRAPAGRCGAPRNLLSDLALAMAGNQARSFASHARHELKPGWPHLPTFIYIYCRQGGVWGGC